MRERIAWALAMPKIESVNSDTIAGDLLVIATFNANRYLTTKCKAKTIVKATVLATRPKNNRIEFPRLCDDGKHGNVFVTSELSPKADI